MVRFSRVGLAAVPMCHPFMIGSRQLMRHDGGNVLKSQDHCEGLRTSPLNPVECDILRTLSEHEMRVPARSPSGGTGPPVAYSACTQVSDPMSLTATSEKNTRIGWPSAVPR